MTRLVLDPSERFKAYEQNMTWFRTHYGRLKKDHPDKFVAISNGKVIDSNKTLEGLLGRLRRQHSDMSSLAIEFVSSNEAELIMLHANPS
jgi:hypothetical protein